MFKVSWDSKLNSERFVLEQVSYVKPDLRNLFKKKEKS